MTEDGVQALPVIVDLSTMERVLVLGRGGAGKSTLARAIGSVTGLPVHELDEHFWQQGLLPLSPQPGKTSSSGSRQDRHG